VGEDPHKNYFEDKEDKSDWDGETFSVNEYIHDGVPMSYDQVHDLGHDATAPPIKNGFTDYHPYLDKEIFPTSTTRISTRWGRGTWRI
jgi:hypothetical protein